MFPFYVCQISTNPLEDGDQDQTQLPPFTLATDTSSYPFPILFNTPQDRVSDIVHRPQQQILEPKPVDLLLIGGPSEHTISTPTNDNYNYNNTTSEQSLCCPYVTNEDPQASGKWMSSKMRIMRKIMNSDQIVMSKPRENIEVVQDQQQPNQDIIRVCSDCNTTKTPLWRSGPRGPKSLCNACGIRQRKVRRAMAAASGGVVTKQAPREESEVDRTVPFKKRCRFTNSGTAQKKLRFDEVTMSSGKNSAFHRVFPQDERDAAILLMALSCGLIRS